MHEKDSSEAACPEPVEGAQKFVEKWAGVELSERAASHEHFIDLCRLIGHIVVYE